MKERREKKEVRREKREEKREKKKERRFGQSPIFSLPSSLSSLLSSLSSLLSSFFFLFSSLFFLLSSVSPVFANPSKSPSTTPMQAVRDLDKMVDRYKVGKKLSKADEEYNRQLKSEILRGTFNLRELARLALAKHWNALSAKEQNRFVEILTQILEERSVFAKEKAAEKGESKSYKIEYKKEKFLNFQKTQGFVRTTVQLKKHRTKLDIDYKLKKNGDGEWQIYDVIVDEASLVDNYRASFGKIIEKNGYPELVRRMESKLKEFRSKRTS